MDLIDLLNLAQVNTEFANITSDVYRRLYSNYEIRIQKTDCEHFEEPCDIKSPGYITLRDINVLANLMKYFGNHIRKLNIWNRPYSSYSREKDWIKVHRIINKYGSETLTHLQLRNVSKTLWPQFLVPFKNVEMLDIEILRDTDGMKLNQLCPKLKDLRINFFKEVNFDFIDCELPQLEHFEVKFYAGIYHTEQIIGLIKKNPQIRSINTVPTNPEFVKLVSELLPQLENVSLQFSRR